MKAARMVAVASSVTALQPDYDTDFPPEAVAFKDAIAMSDAILFVTPEYKPLDPGSVEEPL